MNNKLKKFLIFIAVIILSFILAPYFGRLYEIIIGHGIGSFIVPCPECFEGFMIAFTFFSGLLFFGLLDKKRLSTALVFVVVLPIALLLMKIGEAFLVSLAAGLIGLGLGQIIYLIRKKIKK